MNGPFFLLVGSSGVYSGGTLGKQFPPGHFLASLIPLAHSLTQMAGGVSGLEGPLEDTEYNPNLGKCLDPNGLQLVSLSSFALSSPGQPFREPAGGRAPSQVCPSAGETSEFLWTFGFL